MIQDILRELKRPKEIHSRHEAKAHINDILRDDEKYVYGIEMMDSLFNSYRTRWFLTETQVIFTEGSFPLSFKYDVYPFHVVSDMEYFEDEKVLVIESPDNRTGIEATTELEKQFLTQVVEQYNRFVIGMESMKEQKETDEADEEPDTSEETSGTDSTEELESSE